MIELAPHQFEALAPRLQAVPFNHLFARSVLQRHVDGRVWVSRPGRPALTHVVHPYGMSLLLGEGAALDGAALVRHLAELQSDGVERWLQVCGSGLAPACEALWTAGPGAAPAGPAITRFTRVNFRFSPARYLAMRAPLELPAGITLRPLDQRDFALPGIDVSPHRFWRSASQFLEFGGGWCVEHEQALASMAFCSFRFDQLLEIGVATRPAWRGRGYALQAACVLIDACIARGLEPVWACRKENAASYRLAHRLGFEVACELPYYRLAPAWRAA